MIWGYHYFWKHPYGLVVCDFKTKCHHLWAWALHILVCLGRYDWYLSRTVPVSAIFHEMNWVRLELELPGYLVIRMFDAFTTGKPVATGTRPENQERVGLWLLLRELRHLVTVTIRIITFWLWNPYKSFTCHWYPARTSQHFYVSSLETLPRLLVLLLFLKETFHCLR